MKRGCKWRRGYDGVAMWEMVGIEAHQDGGVKLPIVLGDRNLPLKLSPRPIRKASTHKLSHLVTTLSNPLQDCPNPQRQCCLIMVEMIQVRRQVLGRYPRCWRRRSSPLIGVMTIVFDALLLLESWRVRVSWVKGFGRGFTVGAYEGVVEADGFWRRYGRLERR